MITTGIIKSVDEKYNNGESGYYKYRVLLPMIHTDGTKYSDSELPIGIYATPPHMQKTKLSVGDVVYASLLDLNIQFVIILGLAPYEMGCTESISGNLPNGSNDTKSTVSLTKMSELKFTDDASVVLPMTTKYTVGKEQSITNTELSKLLGIENIVQNEIDEIKESLHLITSTLMTREYTTTIIKGSISNIYINEALFESTIGVFSDDKTFTMTTITGGSTSNSSGYIWVCDFDGKRHVSGNGTLADFGISGSQISYPCTFKIYVKSELVSNLIDTQLDDEEEHMVGDTACGKIPFKGKVVLGHARGGERNSKGSRLIKGGKAGDSDQKSTPDSSGEVSMSEYKTGNFTLVFRLKDRAKRLALANRCVFACNNPNIGYDQNERTTMASKVYSNYKQNIQFGSISTKCECDCSAFVGALLYSVGCGYSTKTSSSMYRKLIDMYTGGESSLLKGTGEFYVYGDSVLNYPSKLKIGDVLLKRKGNSGHTAIVVNVPKGQDNWLDDDGNNYNPNLGELPIGLPSSDLFSNEFDDILNENQKSVALNAYNNGTKQLLIANYTGGNSCKLALYTLSLNGSKITGTINSTIGVINAYTGSDGVKKYSPTNYSNNTTPAGIFKLNKAIGKSKTCETTLDYIQTNSSTVLSSAIGALFNTIIKDASEYAQGERLYDDKYKFAIFFDMNTSRVQNYGIGSFIHCGTETKNGIAVPNSSGVEKILAVLNKNDNPQIYIIYNS